MTDPAFILRVLACFSQDLKADHEELLWSVKGDDVHFAVICSDTFWWGTADSEDVTPENVAELERAIVDCNAVKSAGAWLQAATVFCCRVRQMRPQGAVYQDCNEWAWPLFDAAGPPREVDMGNPRRHPSERPADVPA